MAKKANTTKTARASALESGAVRYFSGRACVSGHLAERYTRSGSCVVCADLCRAACERADPAATSQRQKRSRERRRDQIRAQQSAARRSPEYRAKERARRAVNALARRERERELYRANPERGREKSLRWKERHPEQARAVRRASYKRRMERPAVRVTVAVSNGIRRFLSTDGKRGRRTFDCLPYSPEELVSHLERQFAAGMTWDNYGAWHIDHIIPISAFNFETVEHVDFQRAWALSNLQPLWAADNQSKSARINAPFQPSLAL